MPTVHKRTMVTLSSEVKEALDSLALKKEKSVSKTAAELLEFALMVQEDMYLGELAAKRISENFETISFDEVFKGYE